MKPTAMNRHRPTLATPLRTRLAGRAGAQKRPTPPFSNSPPQNHNPPTLPSTDKDGGWDWTVRLRFGLTSGIDLAGVHQPAGHEVNCNPRTARSGPSGSQAIPCGDPKEVPMRRTAPYGSWCRLRSTGELPIEV